MTEHGTLGSRHRRLSPASLAVPVGGRQLVVRLRPVVWAVGVLVTASAVGAPLLSAYVDVGTLGRLPDLYEPTWAVPGKSSSGVLEGIATFLAIIGFVMAVGPVTRRGSMSRTDCRRGVPARPRLRRDPGPRGAWDPSDGRHDQCLGTHMSVSVETLAILSREVRAGSGQAVIGSAR